MLGKQTCLDVLDHCHCDRATLRCIVGLFRFCLCIHEPPQFIPVSGVVGIDRGDGREDSHLLVSRSSMLFL